MAKRTGLGRGIGALIPTTEPAEERPSDVFFPRSAAGDGSTTPADDTADLTTEELLQVPGARLAHVGGAPAASGPHATTQCLRPTGQRRGPPARLARG